MLKKRPPRVIITKRLGFDDHDCDERSCATASLEPYIDKPKLVAYNYADRDEDLKNVFRSWDRRRDATPRGIRSDDDDCELVLRVPFTCDVKLTGIVILGGANGSYPATLRVFANDTKLDLETIGRKKPTQKFDLVEDFQGNLEYETDRTKFSSVCSVTLHVSKNFAKLRGEEKATEIMYVGLRGEAMGHNRDMIVTAVYETRAMKEDHKVEEENVPKFAM